jgi:group II intron reverse transcriptase/maturase
MSLRRRFAKGSDLAEDNTEPAKQDDRTQSRVRGEPPEVLPNALERIRQVACRDKEIRFTSLWHHVYNIDRLREAYLRLKPRAAAGEDDVTWLEYGKKLEENLRDLSERLATGRYHARPVKRVYIPKGDGKERPIGIPVVEDKIVQRATVAVLNAVYESDFLGFSYGFRPGRNCHMALDALAVGIQRKKVSWILDADIRAFFDTLDHEWLIKFIEHRIADPRIIRHIKKWLNAGVLEEGKIWEQEEGVPQGGSVSPLLANIYLHYVLDLWAEQWRSKQAAGEMIIVRYADDFVAGFQHESDARRFLEELRERFRRFNLGLHAEKTRIIEFGRFAAERREKRGGGKPATFNFLGFTHLCDKTRKGKFTVGRRTMARKMRAKLKALKQVLRKRMHQGIGETGKWLAAVVRGHYQFYGLPRNYLALDLFRHRIRRLWQRALSRRSQKGRITESQMARIADRWLPIPRICHPYPEVRLAVMIQGKSPVR